MKKNVTFAYEADKLKALRLFLGQKDLTLESELLGAADALYAKHVPANVRDYIALCASLDSPPEKTARAASAEPQQDGGD